MGSSLLGVSRTPENAACSQPLAETAGATLKVRPKTGCLGLSPDRGMARPSEQHHQQRGPQGQPCWLPWL